MPHVVIEYSANLETVVDFDALVEAVRAAAVETGVFPLGGIRVRAHCVDHAAIADGDPAHAFVDATLKMGAGRDLETCRRAGAHVFAALSKALDPAFAKTTVALSFEIREVHPELNWKRNSIHEALKQRA
ncbi:5-carboxymethyl-2-hydroxymuconate Delta-isomerase [Phreatobacter sp. AB_2022a]|uniref:5-carboxymethyl-2-hydroxymuconate Delta-isomerase n=1 Tax=Phreatobacter sp. AB_2022a TaxID=3003134 RepID=UPI002286F89B|nr:5-carboxymethyl-2-hydroxymuconate Delta-isomerase [Phreatobacter sp. AB_2022a]MCZ0733635.1 5-carboxymethyl-2-hydroxymuconate Delta-isomerase [Phreatobacter sp. AB_2022a]